MSDEIEELEPTGYAQSNFTIVPNGVLTADINAAALKVYICLRSYVRPGHNTFPKAATVCARFNIPARTFTAALKELQSAGLIAITKRTYAHGFRRANVYYFPDVADAEPLPVGSADSAVPHVPQTANRDVPLFAVPREEEKAQEEKVQENTLAASPLAYTAEFEEAWHAYPRKDDKRSAFKAYKAARKLASQDEILAGIARYRAEDPRRTKQFTKLFSSWLNAGSWENNSPASVSESAPARSAGTESKLGLEYGGW